MAAPPQNPWRSASVHVGRHCHRRRARRLRGRGGLGAGRRAHPSPDPQDRDRGGNELQPGDRRAGEGPSCPRDRRPRRPDGPDGGRGRHPVPSAQPVPRRRRAGPPRPDRPTPLPRGHAGGAGGCPGPGSPRRGGGGPGRGRRPRRRRRRRLGPDLPRRPGGPDHGDLPEGGHSPRRPEDPGRARRRGPRDWPLRPTLRSGPRHGAAEDRHAGAARWPDHRLGSPGQPGCGRCPEPLFLPDGPHHQSAGGLRRDGHDTGDPPHHRRAALGVRSLWRPDPGPWASVLSVHRGQGRPVRGPDQPPDLPRARRPGRSDRLSQRHFHLGLRRDPGPLPAHHTGPGVRAGGPARLCDRVRLCRPP